MATSGSVNYLTDRDGIITEALELLGVLSAGASPSAAELTSCSTTLNMMVKRLVAEGVQPWKVSEGELTLVADQESYTLGPGGDLVIDKPLRILEARRRDENNRDTQLTSISRDEYMMLSDKDSVGHATQYYFQPGTTTSTLFVWPVADATIATNDSIVISYYSQFEDFDAATDDPDFPAEWLEPLSNMLAVRLAPKFGMPLTNIPGVVAIADESKELLLSWGQEYDSVYFGVDNEY